MRKLIAANWKENKTREEALEWLKVFLREFADGQDFSRVVLCPSSPLLYPLREAIARYRLSLKLGAQDVSRYGDGAYTGEVSTRQLEGLVDYVLVGHSERQRYFGETLEDVAAKINLCFRYHLAPLIFLRNLNDLQVLKQNVPSLAETVLVYEPPTAVSRPGVYQSEDPAAAAKVMSALARETGGRVLSVLYGGSVNAKNIDDFLEEPEINGVVVGQASLEPTVFAQLVKKTLKYGAA